VLRIGPGGEPSDAALAQEPPLFGTKDPAWILS
jgi:hypothetical protein